MLKISNSKAKTWRRCQNSYYYKYILNLEPKKKSAALVKGSMIHDMDDAWLNGKDWKKVLDSYQTEYDKLFREEQEEYGDIINDMRTIMENYISFCQDDGLEPVKINGRFSEHEADIELIPNKVIFTFKVDKIIKDGKGRVWLGEKKSFSRGIPKEEIRVSDLQTTLYYWAVQHLEWCNPQGVMWEYVSSKPPSIPKLLKGDMSLSKAMNIRSTYETYLAEIKKHGFSPKDYQGILDDLKARPNQFFRRIYKKAPDKLVEPLLRDLKNTAYEILEMGEILRTRNLTRDCNWCGYYSLCQAELWGLDAEFILQREYKERSDRQDAEKEVESSTD